MLTKSIERFRRKFNAVLKRCLRDFKYFKLTTKRQLIEVSTSDCSFR